MRLAPPGEAVEITTPDALTKQESLEVSWLGPRPAWLADIQASGTLDGVSLTSTVTSSTRIVHLARDAPTTPAAIRAAHPHAAIVADLGAVASRPAESVLAAFAAADVVMVESQADMRRACELAPALEGKVTVAPDAIDLEWHAPEEALNRLQGAYIRRFRRLHRLAHPSILFVGPYTPAGGLDVAIAAAYRLREQFEDVRLAAVPLGSVDRKYLDRCEMEALALGHRGIVEWTVTDEDLRCWYATATVVCCPWREPVEAPVAPALAAAAARPFVGSDLPVFRQSLRPPEAPALVPPGDVDALVAGLAPLLADLDLSSRLGASARETLETAGSSVAAATRLAAVWKALAERSLTEVA